MSRDKETTKQGPRPTVLRDVMFNHALRLYGQVEALNIQLEALQQQAHSTTHQLEGLLHSLNEDKGG
jgi:hypothetical protein